MFKFAADAILGTKAAVRINENQEIETFHRENYTIEELEAMHFVGKEQPFIKRSGVVIIRDGTVVRKYNAQSKSWEFMFIPRYCP